MPFQKVKAFAEGGCSSQGIPTYEALARQAAAGNLLGAPIWPPLFRIAPRQLSRAMPKRILFGKIIFFFFIVGRRF
jgi:hypothetical protein